VSDFLSLFFVYPAALTALVNRPQSEELSWALFGFSPAAALVFLTLLPAIRRGQDYVRDNGSPWRWAWYPWTLFGVLAFAVPARSALLCWSMHHVPSAGGEPYIFGPYFPVPFGIAIAVVLLEIGLVERRRGATVGALLVPPILVFLTLVGYRADPTYQWFLDRFVARLGGTALYLTLLISAGFFAYAALRRVPTALDALMAAMVALAFVAPETLDLGDLVAPRMLPILVVAVSQTAIGLSRRSLARSVIGSAFLVAAAMIAVRGTNVHSHPGPIVFHLALVAALSVGAVFHDRMGHFLRTLGASMAVVGSLYVLIGSSERSPAIASWAIEVYPLFVCMIIAGYGFVLGHRTSLASAGLIVFSWVASVGWRGYCALRQFAAGIDYIAIGMLLFSLAVLTSMVKGGVLSSRTTDHKTDVPDAPE
jgi:energy-converting hydrogenase Eha subunit E